jgi:uncharacterized membrane protein YccC
VKSVQRFWHWLKQVRTRRRLLLAGKTAFAASVAWALAPLMPFTDDRYSYYAPLGAVISMYPTLFKSVRSSVQTLLGLAVGVGLAIGALAVGGPRIVGVGLVVGIGVLLASIPALGAGRDWVPITALFVLLIGGPNADRYSSNYLVHVLLGIVVGIIVNIVIFPPIYLRDAASRLDGLRDMVAEQLRAAADAINHNGGNDGLPSPTRLEETARDVRDAVRQADESRKGNLRGRRSGDLLSESYERLRALEHTSFFVRDLIDIVERIAERDDSGAPSKDVVDKRLPAAITAVADLVASGVRERDSAKRLADAENRVDRVYRGLDGAEEATPSRSADVLAVAVCLRRIIESSRPFVAT